MDTRSRRLAIAAAASLFAWCGGAAAQSAPTVPSASIHLEEAIRLALQQPALRAAAHEVAAGDAAAGQAGSLPNPVLGYLREGQDAGSRTTTIQIEQTIELGGKRQARVALARGEASLARADLAARRRDTRADVIAAYYALLVAADKQALAQELAGVARRSVDVAARRVAAGKSSPLDATRARLAAVDASSGLAKAGAELAIARSRLGALTGQPADAVAQGTGQAGQLPALPPLAILLARTSQGGAVERARSQLAAQEAQTGVERAARIPDLTLTLGSQRAGQNEPGLRSRRQAVFGVALPLPLFDRNQGRLTAALRRTDKARDELAAAGVAARAALADAHARCQAAIEEATLLQAEAVPDAGAAYELTLRGFEAGKFAVLDVLDAQRTWFQVRTQQLDARLAAWRARADIERLTGADE